MLLMLVLASGAMVLAALLVGVADVNALVALFLSEPPQLHATGNARLHTCCFLLGVWLSY